MADRIRVTELDFDTIKNNLKNFLKQQDEFTDYDFDGSGLSILLDILAYNTHYNAYYLNMVANESFLDTALLRDSVVSHAKMLGYVPHSKKSALAAIDLEVTTTITTPGTLTIPRGYKFLSEQIDGKTYTFTLLNDTTVTKSNTSYYFESLPINEGILTSYRFVNDKTNNPKQIFTLPDESIDTQSLTVAVSPSVSNTQIRTYQIVTDLSEVTSDSEVFFLQENKGGKYQIYFGNDVLGKSVPDNGLITVSYLVTSATEGNRANNFVATSPLLDSNFNSLTDFVVTPVSAANGGSDRESVDKIKYAAPLFFSSQNRLVSYKDYEIFIRNAYPNLDSISVWGGEDEEPPVYGKVFVSIKPKNDFYISQAESEKIINDVINPRSMLTIKTEFREPEFLFLIVESNVQYEQNKTTLTKQSLENLIKNSVVLYNNTYLNKFGSNFAISKLQESIDNTDTNSIIGSDSIIRVQKRFVPDLGRITNYTLNFGVSLLQGTPLNRLISSEFSIRDNLGILRKVIIEETPKSFTGINSIEIVDPGVNYSSEPLVKITGDGFGATAKAILSNGKIQRIEITNPGIDYNRAFIEIVGGGGFGAVVVPVIQNSIGILRTVYFTSSAERIVVNTNIGEINYDTGLIKLNDLNIISNESVDGLLRITCGLKNNIIQSQKNTILVIDNEPSSITINAISL